MESNNLLSQLFLPMSSVSLGRFVVSIEDPHQDFHDPLHSTTLAIAEKLQKNFTGTYTSVRHHNASAEIATLLSASFSKRLKTSVQITTVQAKTYYLNNVGDWFQNAVRSRDTQRWIERVIDEGEDIYAIVAYHTLLDAHIQESSGDSSADSGRIGVPLSTALNASGVCMPFVVGDPRLGGSRGGVVNEQGSWVASGEQVHAVQYRKVRWDWFSRKRVEEMKLAKRPFWERYDRLRSAEDEVEGEEEDMIEVDLEDELRGECNDFTIVFGPPSDELC